MISEKLRLNLTIVALLISGVACALVIYFYKNFYDTDLFLPGVKIAGASVQGYDRNQVKNILDEKIQELNQMNVVFYDNDYTYILKLQDLIEEIDMEEFLNDVWKQEKNRDLKSKIINMDGSKKIAYPIAVNYKESSIKALEMQLEADLATPYKNARLEIDSNRGLLIVPGQDGKSIDMASIMEKLPKHYSSIEEVKIPILYYISKPIVNENDLSNMGELATYTTWYKTYEVDRSHNLSLAASIINTAAVPPGGIFSFNETVGRRSLQAGYRDALIIINGKFEPGLAGGICQVSSTLYNTALLAGMEIVERSNHSLAITYVPLGRDATVSYGVQDFKFRNNTNHPIYIRSIASGGSLTMTIYGNIKFKHNIQLSHVVDQFIPFETIREFNPDLAPGKEVVEINGANGYVVRSFRTIYDEAGVVISSTQLARDYYRPLTKIVQYRDAEAQPIEPEQDPNNGNGQDAKPENEEEIAIPSDWGNLNLDEEII